MERAIAVVAILMGVGIIGGGAVLAVTFAGGGFGAAGQPAPQEFANATIEVRCYTSECREWVGEDNRVRLIIEHVDYVNGSYVYRPVTDTSMTVNQKFEARLHRDREYRIQVADHGDVRTLGLKTVDPDENIVIAPFPCCGDGPFPTPDARYRNTPTQTET